MWGLVIIVVFCAAPLAMVGITAHIYLRKFAQRFSQRKWRNIWEKPPEDEAWYQAYRTLPFAERIERYKFAEEWRAHPIWSEDEVREIRARLFEEQDDEFNG